MFGRSLLALGGLAVLSAVAVGAIVLRGQGSGAGAPDTTDRAGFSYVGNLLAKEESGEWTRGEGLVATLKLFEGEAEASSVLRHGEPLERTGTGIISLAEEYLESGDDEAAKAEIARLLDQRLYDPEELEAMAGLSAAAALPRGLLARPALAPQECKAFFEGVNLEEIPAIGCVTVREVAAGGKVHRIWAPVDGVFDHPWTQKHYDLAAEAIAASMAFYGSYGNIPPTNIVFYVSRQSGVLAEAVPHKGGQCGIGIMTSMAAQPDGKFRQVIAHEAAHCFQEEIFDFNDYGVVKWREEGLSEFLGAAVYSDVNAEWDYLDYLGNTEYNNTILDRDYENWIFFQFLANELGIIGMLDGLNTIGAGDQAAGLAAITGMNLLYDAFQHQLTNSEIRDQSGIKIPVQITIPPVTVAGPKRIADEPVKAFGVRRRLVTVPDKMQAYFSVGMTGDGFVSAAPLSGPTSWRDMPTAIPEGDGCEGERRYIVIATTIVDGTEWALEALGVEKKDEEKCEPKEVEGRDKCLIGVWNLDLDVLTAYVMAEDPPDFETQPYTGVSQARYGADGNVEFIWGEFSNGYKQAMTDAYGKDMGIGGKIVVNGNAMKSWRADGRKLQYESGSADVWMKITTMIKGKEMSGGWRDISERFGGTAPDDDGLTGTGEDYANGADVNAPKNILGGTLGGSVQYSCRGNRLEIQHNLGWTLVWHRQ